MSTSDDDSATEPTDGYSLAARGQQHPAVEEPKVDGDEVADEPVIVVEWFQRDPDGGEG
jgi:hypothetical protein